MIGVGLSILGIGFPAGIAMMRLLPSRNGASSGNGFVSKDLHKSQLAEINRRLAALEETTTAILKAVRV